MARSKSTKGVSLRSADFTEGGLWPVGGAVEPAKLSLKFTKHTFKDKEGNIVKGHNGLLKDIPVLMATFETPELKEPITETYGVGDGFDVSKDGAKLLPQKQQTGLNKNCRAAMLIASLEESGDFDDLLDKAGEEDDITVFDGVAVLAYRKPLPKRQGSDKESSIILVKGAGTGKGSTKPKARDDDDEDEDDEPQSRETTRRAAKSSGRRGRGRSGDEDEGEDDESVETLAITALKEVLDEAGDEGVDLSDVEDAVFKHAKGHPQRKEMAAWAADRENLNGRDGKDWEIENDVILSLE